MVIDCGTCEVAGDACTDCVVSVLLGFPAMPNTPNMPNIPGTGGLAAEFGPAGALEIADEHRAALDVLAGSGLIPPLRLVRAKPEPGVPSHRAS
jgi:hypothetical protein